MFILLPALLFGLVDAHTYIESLNGSNKCLRKIREPSQINFPVFDPSSPDMKCNVLGNTAVDGYCSENPGDTLNFKWTHGDGEVIAPSHKGPCSVYVSGDNGNSWAKIWESGYNPSTKKWCTEQLIQDKGVMTFSLPKNMGSGNYLLRGEIIALHEGQTLFGNGKHGAQYYMGCAQIRVGGSSSSKPSPVVSIPGYIKATDPGVHYDIYYGNDPAKYPIPGPPIATWSGSSTSNHTLSAIAKATPTSASRTSSNTQPTNSSISAASHPKKNYKPKPAHSSSKKHGKAPQNYSGIGNKGKGKKGKKGKKGHKKHH